MNDSLAQRILAKIGVAILIVAVVALLFLKYWVISQDQKLKIKDQNVLQTEEKKTEVAFESPSPYALPSPMPSIEPKTEVRTVETKTVVEKESQTIVQTAQKEIFIPIGGGSTFSNSYIDLAGLEVSIDTAKYSTIESVVFEASVRVQDGNGKMYTQLYNVSDKHPVWNSEISTGSSTSILATSPKIILDSGAKIYRVQAKTNLTSYAAHVDNARIKITLK